MVFAPGEAYLTLARFTGLDHRSGPASDYTGQEPYFRSIQRIGRTGPRGGTDRLTMYDYLWRWDTDWFWCSGAFGLHDPRVRRLWPRRWKRSDVYHRIVGLENRYQVKGRLDRRRGLPERERVIQDVEIPVDALPAFLTWFDDEVGMRPVWLCPLRSTRELAVVPARPRRDLRQRRLLGDGADRARRARRRPQPCDRGARSPSSADTSRSTPTPTTTGPPSTGSTTRTSPAPSRKQTDPDGRLTDLYEKAVERR